MTNNVILAISAIENTISEGDTELKNKVQTRKLRENLMKSINVQDLKKYAKIIGLKKYSESQKEKLIHRILDRIDELGIDSLKKERERIRK